MINKKLNSNIKRLEEKSGLKRSRIVEGLDVSSTTYTNWISGVCDPKIKHLISLSDFYKVTIDELLGIKK